MTRSIKCIVMISLFLMCCAFFAEAQRRPVIGISDLYKDGNNSAVPRSYVDAVLHSGGLPIVIPLMYDDEKIIELLNNLDGIIFTGGEDFDPAYYNERPIPQMGKVNAPRDEFDIKLLHLAVKQGVPVLGICRGLQLINIAYGGSLYQDLSAQYHDNSIRHRQKQPKEDASHSVLVENNTVFADIVQERMLMVNSSHHQAIKKVAPGFRVAGKSPDKIVEVIEKIDSENWILGVQFHPEVRVTRDNAMRKIFQRFVEVAINLEKPERKLSASTRLSARSQINREYDQDNTSGKSQIVPSRESQITPFKESQVTAAIEPQIVYKSVVDTQYIYKIIVDTQFVSMSTDTVYLPAETKYVYAPSDTVYVSVIDTIYFPAEEINTLDSGKPKTKPVPVTATAPTPTSTPTPTSAPAPAPEKDKSISDSMIFTPGETILPVEKESSKLKQKNKKKEAAKEAKEAKAEAKNVVKKDAEEKELQKQKDQTEGAKQNIKEVKDSTLQAKKDIEEKEQKEKEEWAKKEAKEKEKQFKKYQKENAKKDKMELKEKKAQDKKDLKEKKS